MVGLSGQEPSWSGQPTTIINLNCSIRSYGQLPSSLCVYNLLNMFVVPCQSALFKILFFCEEYISFWCLLNANDSSANISQETRLSCLRFYNIDGTCRILLSSETLPILLLKDFSFHQNLIPFHRRPWPSHTFLRTRVSPSSTSPSLVATTRLQWVRIKTRQGKSRLWTTFVPHCFKIINQ